MFTALLKGRMPSLGAGGGLTGLSTRSAPARLGSSGGSQLACLQSSLPVHCKNQGDVSGPTPTLKTGGRASIGVSCPSCGQHVPAEREPKINRLEGLQKAPPYCHWGARVTHTPEEKICLRGAGQKTKYLRRRENVNN